MSITGNTTTAKKRKQDTLMARDALQAYLDREDFHFDLNGDMLYQQYKNQYVNQGKRAMEDAMGTAAALTGGYANSYAQSVGQQTYQSYLEKLGQAVPELYRAAYDRYTQEGQALYDRYAALAKEEDRAYARQQDALQAQWKQEELDYRKQRDLIEDERYEKEFQLSIQRYQQENGDTLPQYTDYTAMLASRQGKGTMLDETGSRMTFNNGQVTTGNIMTVQRVLGLPADGLWKRSDSLATGGKTADQVWAAYQRGSLPYYSTNAVEKDRRGDIRTLERILGTQEDGVWSYADRTAAGGMSFEEAWESYKRGAFQYR